MSSRSQIYLNVQQDVTEVNQITQQIAALNAKLGQVSNSGADYGSFLDQRNRLIQKLSGLIDVSTLNDGSSLTLTMKRGTALVVDGQSYDLSTALDKCGTQHIYSQGSDITGEIDGGEIGECCRLAIPFCVLSKGNSIRWLAAWARA